MLLVLRWQPPAISRAIQRLFLRCTWHSLSGPNVQCPSRNSLRSNFHSAIKVNWIPSLVFGPWRGTQLAGVSHSRHLRRQLICQHCTGSLTNGRYQPGIVDPFKFHSEWQHSNSTHNRWRCGSRIAMATTLSLVLCGNAKGIILLSVHVPLASFFRPTSFLIVGIDYSPQMMTGNLSELQKTVTQPSWWGKQQLSLQHYNVLQN